MPPVDPKAFSPFQADGKDSMHEDQRGYALVPLGELMGVPDAPVDYLLEKRLVAGTVSVVVAKPKVGKVHIGAESSSRREYGQRLSWLRHSTRRRDLSCVGRAPRRY